MHFTAARLFVWSSRDIFPSSFLGLVFTLNLGRYFSVLEWCRLFPLRRSATGVFGSASDVFQPYSDSILSTNECVWLGEIWRVKLNNMIFCRIPPPSVSVTATAPPTPHPCSDKKHFCTHWKNAGFCEGIFANYMKKNCPASCGLC